MAKATEKTQGLDMPVKAMASIVAALTQKETGLWPKEPGGRQCQCKSDLYICEPGKEPGTVDVRIERDQTAYRNALDTFTQAETRKSIALQAVPGAERALQLALKVKNKDHAAQHQALLDSLNAKVEQATKDAEAAAEMCPQAHFESLTNRAKRSSDLAKEQEELATKKLADAEELDDRAKKDNENKDKFSAMAKGCREAASLAEATAKRHRAKEQEFLDARPDCSGVVDFIEKKTVRILIVEA